MPSLARTLLGRPARRRKPEPPAVSARRAPPAPAPAAPAAPPQRRPAPEVEPATPKTIRALLVDPAKRTVEEVQLVTEPGNPRNGYGTQIAKGEIEDLVGAEDIEVLDLGDGNSVAVDALRQSETVEIWTLGDDEPIAGPGVIVGYDQEADEYGDTALSVDEIRRLVTFEAGDEADADEMRAAIASRIETLDGAQLRRVLEFIDRGGLEAEEPDETTDQMKRTT